MYLDLCVAGLRGAGVTCGGGAGATKGRHLLAVAMAILDCVAMNAIRLDIDGPSYRHRLKK